LLRRLQRLNTSNIELFVLRSANNIKKIPPRSEIIESADVVRDLGVMLDAQLLTQENVSKTVQAYFFHLRRLRSVRWLHGCDVTIHLVIVRLDYCNAVLAGLPAIILALLRVPHTTVCSMNDLRPHEHVTHSLKELHWLQIAPRNCYESVLFFYVFIGCICDIAIRYHSICRKRTKLLVVI